MLVVEPISLVKEEKNVVSPQNSASFPSKTLFSCFLGEKELRLLEPVFWNILSKYQSLVRKKTKFIRAD